MVSTTGVTNPAPEAVYQTQRFGNFTYALPQLIAGYSYTVRLHFAEGYWRAAGKRVFNVSINGAPVLTNFDIYAAAGGENIAVVKQFTATANASGQIVIVFTTDTDNAAVRGSHSIFSLCGCAACLGLSLVRSDRQGRQAGAAPCLESSNDVCRTPKPEILKSCGRQA